MTFGSRSSHFCLFAVVSGMCVILFVYGLNSLGCCLQLFSLVARGQLSVSVARGQLFVLDLFSILVGFRCECVNAWWCRSIVFEIISWLP